MALGIVLLSDDFTANDNEHVANLLDNEERDQVDLCISLTSGIIPDFILNAAKDKFAGKVTEFSSQNLISGCFMAKDKLDKVMCPEVKVICKRKQEVDFLCQVIFTPAVKWSVLSVGEDCSSKNETVESITKKFKDYLSKLEASDDVNILCSALIPNEVFYHGFSKRTGGLSSIPGMKSLNLVYTTAKRDPLVLIQENRRRLATKAGFDAETLFIAKAVHGNVVYEVGTVPPDEGYDGVISNKYDVTCAAPGADCVIILFADPIKHVFAAIHSGWKGTVAKIPTVTVKTMQEKFGSKIQDIKVVMGPSICKNCFEFGKDDVKQFEDINPLCVLSKDTDENPTVDLKLAIRTMLEEEGVLPDHIDDTTTSPCTTENPDQLFSYRRDGRPFGNQLGFIGLRPK